MDYNFNNNRIKNYEQLQREYFKQADYQNYMKNYDFSAPVEEIAPLEPLDFNFDKKPNNYNGLNGVNKNDKSSYFDYFNREKDIEKEKEKKKQIEYKKQLEEQILENKIRKEKEKEKRRQEDIIYEQKMKEERIRFQKEEEQEKLKKKNMYDNFFKDNQNNQNNQISNGNVNYNKEELEQELFNSHPGLEKIMKNIKKPNEEINNSPYQLNNSNNQNFNNNNNNLYNTNFSNNFQNPNFYNNNQQFINSQNNYENQNNQNRYINNSRNNFQNQIQYQTNLTEPNNIISSPSKPEKILNNNYYISNNIPQNQLNINNNSQDHNYYQNNNIQLPHTPQTQKVNSINFSKPNIDTSFNTQIPNQNYQFSQPNQIMNTSSPNLKLNMSNNIPTYNTNFNNNQFNNPNYNTNMNNNLSYPPILEKIFDFFKEQVRIIQDYKTRIDQLQNERDQAIFQNKANEEKILAMERIKEQQDKMEKNFGNLPYYQGIKNNMEHTISTLLEKDESMIRKNKMNNINNNEINNLIKDITYKSKYENQDNNINIMNNNNNNNNSFSKKDISKKFQDNKIEESNILNIDENDITYSSYYDHNESPNPLITSTKLVKQNGEKKLMETWVKDDNMSNMKNNQNYISKNTNNSNYSHQNKNENVLNSKFRPIYDDNINNLNYEKESNEIPFIPNEESNQRIDINNDNLKKINNLFNKKKNKNNETEQNLINLDNKQKIETKVKLVNPTLNEKKKEINQKKQLITPIIKKEENIIEEKKIEKIITQNEILEEINTNKNNISTIPKNPLDDKSFSIDENVKPLTNLNDNDLNINDLNDNSFNIETNEQNDKSSFSNIKENNNVDSVIEEEERDYKNNSQINVVNIKKNEVKEIPKNIILLNKDNNITISNSLSRKFNDKKCLLSSERYEKNQNNDELNEDKIILKGNKDNNNFNSIHKVIKDTVQKEMQNKDMNIDTLEKDSKLNFEFDDEISSRINKNNIIKKSLTQIDENNNNTISKRSISNYDDNNIFQKSISQFEDRIKYNNHDLSNDNDFVNIGNQDDDSKFINKFENKTENKIDKKLENKFENNLDENYEDDIEEDIKIENDKDKEYDIDNIDRKEIENLKNKNIFNNNYTNNNTLFSNNNNNTILTQNNTISSNQNTLKYRENIGNLNYHFSLTRQKNPFELAHLSKEIPTKIETKEYEYKIGKNDKITEKNESEISSEIPFIKNINKNPNPILENSELKQSDILNTPYSKKYNESLKENNEILLNQMTSLKEDLKINNSKEIKTSNKIDNINIESQQRMPRGVTATNIKNLNDMYSSFKKKKIEKSLVSIENSRADNNSIFNESIVSSNNKRINIRKVNDNSSVFSNNKGDDELFNKVGKYAKFANDEIDQI